MATLSITITVGSGSTYPMKFEPSMQIFDACRQVRDSIEEANEGDPSDYGLFLSDDDPKKGVWLDAGHTLEHYLLRNGDKLEYKNKMRIIRVRMLDDSVKTLMVDDSHTIAQLMIAVCSRIGITNHDEYSLIYELSEIEKDKQATLRREKTLARDQKKLDEMRKKLHTDDELNWLDHSKTLRLQGINEGDTLLLRRKFFFSDQNIDARDPVQLNLLYVQMRDAILNGAHPITMEEAIQFSGFQCQIQFGDHQENRHKPGFLSDLKEFLPKEYVKTKGIEKKVFMEHKKLYGLQEIEAKVRYTQLCRSLKTYGITFFLVKEKLKGKNKLVPRLFGVTKESVVRVDERTKEIIKLWPLTHVRRWAASPNSFTLDFGDHSEAYYSVQTIEGEQISHLISGYIDIILKKKKGGDHLGLEGEEESMMLEESVSPARATIIQHNRSRAGHASTGSIAKPAIVRHSGHGQSAFEQGSMGQPKFPHTHNQAQRGHMPVVGGKQSAEVHALSQSQRGLLGTLSSAMGSIRNAENDLSHMEDLPPLGTDASSQKWRQNTFDISKQNVNAHVSAVNAATAQIINLTAGQDETDFSAVGSAVHTISSNVTGMTKDVRLLAALRGQAGEVQNGRGLLDAARMMTNALGDLLNSAQPSANEPSTNLLGAATRVGEASGNLMRDVNYGETTAADHVFEEALLSLAKAVANTTAALVVQAKSVAERCDEPASKNDIIASATHCALATSQLVGCAKVTAPTIANPACQEQVTEAAKLVAQSLQGVINAAKQATADERHLADLGNAATAVSKALNDLLSHIKRGVNANSDAVDTILDATDKLFSSMGDAPEMVKQARAVAQATSLLISAIKGEADENNDKDSQRRLQAAARALADATSRMVEAAKGCATNPHDSSQQHQLKGAAEDLRTATNAAAQNALRRRQAEILFSAALQTCSAAAQLAGVARAAGDYNSSPQSQQTVDGHCEEVVGRKVPLLVAASRAVKDSPEDPATVRELVRESLAMLQPGGKLCHAVKAVIPTVQDSSVQLSLTGAVQQLSAALAELRSQAGKAEEACSRSDMDGALAAIAAVDEELADVRKAAVGGTLMPLPGQTVEVCANQLGSASKVVGSSMAALLTAAVQGNEEYTNSAVGETASALRGLALAVRGVAATTQAGGDVDGRLALIDAARDVMDKSSRLVEETKRALASPHDPDNQIRLAQVAKAVSNSLTACVNCLPGQRDIDRVLLSIEDVNKQLVVGQYPSTTRSYGEVQEALAGTAGQLNEAASDIVSAARSSPQKLAVSSSKYGQTYQSFVNEGMTVAGMSGDGSSQTQIVGGLHNVSVVSTKLLMAAKSASADPNAPNAKNLLTQAARNVTESVNQLLDACATAGAPGQKGCDSAMREIQHAGGLLDDPNEAVSDKHYHQCLDLITAKSKTLGRAMTDVTTHCREGDVPKFCSSVRQFSAAVCGLAEADAQAAYLVGIGDRGSEPSRPGLVDHPQFARASEAIQAACGTLSAPASTQSQVLNAATVVAKHTSALCNVCRVASSQTANPVAKGQFVQSAMDIANNTATLVKAIKVLDGDFSPENKSRCKAAAQPLIDAVDRLTVYSASPEFASTPARISKGARQAQDPILSSGRQMIDGALLMMGVAKSMAGSPRDPNFYQQFSAHSKTLSEAMKRLVMSVREAAPGQRECDAAVENLGSTMKDLDAASLAATSQSLEPRAENNVQGFQEQLLNSCKQLLASVDPVAVAARGSAEALGHRVSLLASYFEPLADGAVGAASHTMNSKQQMELIDHSKSVLEAGLQFAYVVKEAGGNPRVASRLGPNLDEASGNLKEAATELLTAVEGQASAAGIVSVLIDNISRSMAQTDRRPAGAEMDNTPFVTYQTRMVQHAKNVAKMAQEMLTKSSSADTAPELGNIASHLAKEYDHLCTQQQGASAATPNREVANRLRSRVHDLGSVCVPLVQAAGNVQSNPGDDFSKKDMGARVKAVTEKVSYILAALQDSSRGTQACINAASVVSGIIGDLDTTIMFATAGTLNPDQDDNTPFPVHRENVLRTAKALVEDTKTMVSGATGSQEQLATAAQSAVATITQLTGVVKMGAASLGSNQPEAQVLLINAVKDVASALGDLISGTKNAAGKPPTDPSMGFLKESAKVMVTNVTSLLKTVKTVEDEAARGTQALLSSIEILGQEIRAYNTSPPEDSQKASPETLIRYTKPLTTATAKTVAAGNSCSQDDVIAAANMGRKAITDVLNITKGAVLNTDNPEIRQRTLAAGRDTAQSYQALLQLLAQIVQQPGQLELKRQLPVYSRNVATSVSHLVQAAQELKGSGWVDPEDPTFMAENELLGAAKSIEAAAKKLAMLKPRPQTKEANENLTFDEQILDAAKSIAAATAALVKSASVAQRELVAQGRVRQSYNKHNMDEEGQWSQGLISAARLVAASTHSLCESANAMVQGMASEENLISSAKQVAASTAQLLVACTVKADPNSMAMKRLQAAGNAVKKATEALVRAAQQVKEREEEQTVNLSKKTVVRVKQLIDVQTDILKKERDLEDARRMLADMRKQEYRDNDDLEDTDRVF